MTEPPPPSLWSRYWSPTRLLERPAPDATPQEIAAVRLRNDVWLKTYMDMYILRWGALWMLSLLLLVLAGDDAVPSLFFVLALAASLAALAGLVSMIVAYRRAARAVSQAAQGR